MNQNLNSPGFSLTVLLDLCGDPSGTAMAKKLEVTPMTVYRWKNSDDMSLTRAIKLADYFGLSLHDFLTWESKNESDNSNLKPLVEGASDGDGGTA